MVGRCEDGERSWTGEGVEQVGLDHRCHQGAVVPAAVSGLRDALGRGVGHQDLVNDVNHTVGSRNVGLRDVGVVNHHAAVHGEGERVAVDGGGFHAIGDVGRRDFARHDVVFENFSERVETFACGEIRQVDVGIGKGLVGRCEDGERTRALQGFQQTSLNNRRRQRVVRAGAACRPGDVARFVGGGEDLVDDVDDAVAGHHVGEDNVGVVDHHAAGRYRKANVLAVEHGGVTAVDDG